MRHLPEVRRLIREGLYQEAQASRGGGSRLRYLPVLRWDMNDVVYVLTWRNRFRDVFLGAPGGAGPVLDHFNRHAVEQYLNRTSDRLKPALGEPLGRRIRAMFCDSIELEGANWTGDLLSEFETRRGYDLAPWLPLVLHREVRAEATLAETIRRVRFDYSLTLAELFMERFIEPFHSWCRAHGMLSRYQAYGYP